MLYLDLDGVFSDFYKAAKEVSGIEGYSLEVWKSIKKIPNFYYKLEVLPDSYRFLYFLDSHNIPYEFLSALPKVTGKLGTAQKDKVRWVQRKLNDWHQVNIVQDWSHKKYFCTSSQDVLVDDQARNCNDWMEQGGIAIMHTDFDSTINKLKEIYL